MRFSLTISRYLIGAILPYFFFSWLLSSVILFVQQGSRFAEIFFSANIPSNLVWQLTIALIPNVIAFTCPVAVLVGVIIGLSKMQSDNELVVIRSAGVGNFQITLPIILLAILLSAFAFIVNLYGVPLAARIVRRVALQTAIYKLESPIEPGVFNTEIAGYTIYVRDGDIADGKWKNIFVHQEDEKTGTIRLVTSSNGRIDSTGEYSELVLENAVATTFNRSSQERLVSEHIGDVRFAIQTRRGELIQKLSTAELTPEELGLAELADFAQKKGGREGTEAEILWQRRIVLSLSPLIFALLGTSLILRFNRGGRGFGIAIALGSLVVYFLLTFLGEQLARTERISVVEGGLIPLVVSFLAIAWFNFSPKLAAAGNLSHRIREWASTIDLQSLRPRRANRWVDITTGIRDFDLIGNILKYYVLTVCFLVAMFVIFTAFELWKFAGTMNGGIPLLLRYLFYLLPSVIVQLGPACALVSTLATYVIKSRQNEIVTWTSAGQSVYRLLLPCLLVMIAVGMVNWGIQEWVAPRANQLKDEYRAQIRSRGIQPNRPGKLWVSSERRIYSFDADPTQFSERGAEIPAHNTFASDNATRSQPGCPAVCAVRNLTIYEFGSLGQQVQAVYRANSAAWEGNRIRFDGPAEKVTIEEGRVATTTLTGGEVTEAANPFAEVRKKAAHLTTSETRTQLQNTEAEVERRQFGVALEKKYTTFFLPFVIALFTAPFALSLSRKGKVTTVGYAVGLWLLFVGLTSVFEQFGLNGYLSPLIAVWGPLFFFSLLGIFLMSRVRT